MNSPKSLIDGVDRLLTDSKHPLDEHHARRLTLELLREIFRDQLDIKADLEHIQEDIAQRRALLDATIAKVQKDMDELWRQFRAYPPAQELAEFTRHFREYPSLTWLLRHRTKLTISWLVGFVVVVIILFLTYHQWLLSRLGLPPLVILR